MKKYILNENYIYDSPKVSKDKSRFSPMTQKNHFNKQCPKINNHKIAYQSPNYYELDQYFNSRIKGESNKDFDFNKYNDKYFKINTNDNRIDKRNNYKNSTNDNNNYINKKYNRFSLDGCRSENETEAFYNNYNKYNYIRTEEEEEDDENNSYNDKRNIKVVQNNKKQNNYLTIKENTYSILKSDYPKTTKTDVKIILNNSRNSKNKTPLFNNYDNDNKILYSSKYNYDYGTIDDDDEDYKQPHDSNENILLKNQLEKYKINKDKVNSLKSQMNINNYYQTEKNTDNYNNPNNDLLKRKTTEVKQHDNFDENYYYNKFQESNNDKQNNNNQYYLTCNENLINNNEDKEEYLNTKFSFHGNNEIRSPIVSTYSTGSDEPVKIRKCCQKCLDRHQKIICGNEHTEEHQLTYELDDNLIICEQNVLEIEKSIYLEIPGDIKKPLYEPKIIRNDSLAYIYNRPKIRPKICKSNSVNILRNKITPIYQVQNNWMKILSAKVKEEAGTGDTPNHFLIEKIDKIPGLLYKGRPKPKLKFCNQNSFKFNKIKKKFKTQGTNTTIQTIKIASRIQNFSIFNDKRLLKRRRDLIIQIVTKTMIRQKYRLRDNLLRWYIITMKMMSKKPGIYEQTIEECISIFSNKKELRIREILRKFILSRTTQGSILRKYFFIWFRNMSYITLMENVQIISEFCKTKFDKLIAAKNWKKLFKKYLFIFRKYNIISIIRKLRNKRSRLLRLVRLTKFFIDLNKKRYYHCILVSWYLNTNSTLMKKNQMKILYENMLTTYMNIADDIFGVNKKNNPSIQDSIFEAVDSNKYQVQMLDDIPMITNIQLLNKNIDKETKMGFCKKYINNYFSPQRYQRRLKFIEKLNS